jgi:NAD(P)-dependent dehydrogenase (short-subunit alcohol dehydrogenase family)
VSMACIQESDFKLFDKYLIQHSPFLSLKTGAQRLNAKHWGKGSSATVVLFVLYYIGKGIGKMVNYAPSTKPTAKYYAFCVLFTSTVMFFFTARLSALISLASNSPLQAICIAFSSGATLLLFVLPPVLSSSLLRRIGCISMVIYSLKTEMDHSLKKLNLNMDLTDSVCLVTGANSGVGYGITRLLVERGGTVIMACRSLDKCKQASEKIEAEIIFKKNKVVNTTAIGTMRVMQLDLGDIYSVKAFATKFSLEYDRLDVLVNNAGLVPKKGERTAQGFEVGFGVMHIGHFALTKYLMPLLLTPIVEDRLPHPFKSGARVVNVGSETFLLGSFDESLMESDFGLGDLFGEITDNHRIVGPLTDGYTRAKLANVLYTHELQRRHDLNAVHLVRQGIEAPRRLVTSVVHPGEVATNLHWTFQLFNKFFRTSAQAAEVILYALQSDEFVPGAYIDGMAHSHDLQSYRDLHLPIHLEAYPFVLSEKLPFTRPNVIEHFSMPEWAFKGKNLLTSLSKGSVSTVPTHFVAVQLWDISDAALG